MTTSFDTDVKTFNYARPENLIPGRKQYTV